MSHLPLDLRYNFGTNAFLEQIRLGKTVDECAAFADEAVIALDKMWRKDFRDLKKNKIKEREEEIKREAELQAKYFHGPTLVPDAEQA
jgi:hypothetical protein